MDEAAFDGAILDDAASDNLYRLLQYLRQVMSL